MSLLSHDQRGQVTQCNRKLFRKRQRDVADGNVERKRFVRVHLVSVE